LRGIRFHGLRHSAASILIAQGVHPKAIQELLRHSSIQFTMDIYGHLFEQVQQETADKMDEVLGQQKANPRAGSSPTQSISCLISCQTGAEEARSPVSY
jgi:site-specific recombinase XerC